MLSDVPGTSIPSLPSVLLLNDDSVINVRKSQRRLLLLGPTAAEKYEGGSLSINTQLILSL